MLTRHISIVSFTMVEKTPRMTDGIVSMQKAWHFMISRQGRH